MSDRSGQQLGNYQLIRLLDRGGFAEVYLAEHVYLGTEAAIKLLTTRLNTSEIEQFRNEARMIAALRHPHIVRVLDFGVAEDAPFLVMDYAAHGTLRNLYPRGTRLSPAQLLPHVKQTAAALQFAHDRKLIHRDIKPENMLLDEHDAILLSDFGIATVAHSSHSLPTQNITGTVAYMAPEQLLGKPRIASDQYALGIVVYEWLTGSWPFHGAYVEIGIQHALSSPPPLCERAPDVPVEIERVVMKALAKDPHQRFTCIQDFAQALELACAEQGHNPSFTAPITQAAPSQPDVTPAKTLVTYRNHTEGLKALAWSPDGESIASAGFDRTVQVWQASSGRPEFTFQGHNRAVYAVAWSPNSSHIASAGSGESVLSWQPRTGAQLATYTCQGAARVVKSLAWSPDSSRLAAATGGGKVEIWQATTAHPLLSYAGHSSPVNAVAWSPDGSKLASASGDGSVQLWSGLDGRTLITYREHTKAVYALAWSPDSSRLASASGDGSVQLWSAAGGQPLLTYRGHSQCVYALAWSPDGNRLASAGDDKTVQIWSPLDGSPIATYRGHASFVVALAWSPDSSRIASAGDDKIVHVWQVR